MNARWPIRSVLAGTAGTAALSLAYVVERKLRPRHQGPLDYDDSLVPGKIVASIMHLPHVTAREDRDIGWTLRWSYGSAFGLWHGILRRKVGEPWASAIFGGTLMTTTFTMFPLLGRTPPPWKWPPDVMATCLGTHAAYIGAVAAVDDGSPRGTLSRAPAAGFRDAAGDGRRRGSRLQRIPGSRHVIQLGNGEALGGALVSADLVDDAVDRALEQVTRLGVPATTSCWCDSSRSAPQSPAPARGASSAGLAAVCVVGGMMTVALNGLDLLPNVAMLLLAGCLTLIVRRALGSLRAKPPPHRPTDVITHQGDAHRAP